MELKKSLEILEIGVDATEEQVKTAYRDLVAVWHPDRFSQNPRLREKAEKKLKEANLAYETVKAHLLSVGKRPSGSHKRRASQNHEHHSKQSHNSREKEGSTSKTELAAELGTEAALTLWSYLSKKINHLWQENTRSKGHMNRD